MARSHKQLRGLDLNLLFTFDALLHYGSVTRAAHHLDITQSAVSHSLNKLRTFFGDPLFVKGQSGVVPTERALMLAKSVRQIVSVARETLTANAAFNPAVASRTVTLAMSDMGEISILPAIAQELGSIAPMCSVRTVNLHTAGLEQALESGDVDLVISGPLRVSPSVLQQRLHTHSYSVIVAPTSKISGILSLAQYSTLDHVTVAAARPDLNYRNLIWRKLDVTPRAYLTTANHTVIPWIIARNPQLIATVPEPLARMYAGLRVVRIVRTEFSLPSFPIHQYWHRRFGEDQFNAWFRSIVLQLARKQSSWRGSTPGTMSSHHGEHE
jgi:DNA-binding transcriptional LysR family regulator